MRAKQQLRMCIYNPLDARHGWEVLLQMMTQAGLGHAFTLNRPSNDRGQRPPAKHRRTACGLSILLTLFSPLARALQDQVLAPGYQLRPLTERGAREGVTEITLRSINDEGLIVGSAQFGELPRGFLLDEAGFLDLGTLGGTSSDAFAINGQLEVVGQGELPQANLTRAFRWSGGVMEDLLAPPGGVSSLALDLNEAGIVVGSSVVARGPEEMRVPVMWSDEGPIQLETPWDGTGAALAVNEAVEVGGWAEDQEGVHKPLLWRDRMPLELNTLGGDFGEILDLSDKSVTVGWSRTKGGRLHATAWVADVPYDLGTLGGMSSRAVSIGEAGHIVGQSQLAEDADTRATLWLLTEGGNGGAGSEAGVKWLGPLDLNERLHPSDRSIVLTDAVDVNLSGQILAQGRLADGSTAPFLLEPVADDADEDGLPFLEDNCPDRANPPQTDGDGDGWGDDCDECPDDDMKAVAGACGCGEPELDFDGDGVSDCVDNCPQRANPDQADTSGDQVGDACQEASAGDGTAGGLCGTGSLGAAAMISTILFAAGAGGVIRSRGSFNGLS